MVWRALLLCAAAALVGCQSVFTALPEDGPFVIRTCQNQPPEEPLAEPLPPPELAPARTGLEARSTTPAQPAGPILPAPPNDPEAVPAGAPAGALTLEQLQGMALASHPAIAEAALRVEALRGKFVQAGLPPNLIAGYSGTEIGNEGQAGQQGVYLEQEFVTGGKLGLARQVVCWEIQRAEHQLRAMERRVLTDVQLAYYDVLVAQRRLKLAAELVRISSEAAKNIDALVKAMERSQVDLLQAQIEAQSGEIVAANARAAHAAAWRRLAVLVSDPDLPPAELAGDPAADLPRLDFAELTARVMAEHPELAAAWADVQRARWQVDREAAQVTPNLDVQLLLQHDNATTDDIVGVQATLPLPILNRNQGGIHQAEAEALAAQQSARKLELSLRGRLAATWQRYETAQQQVVRYTKEILPRSEKSLALTRQAFEATEFDYLQLLTAQRTYFQAHLASLDALAELRAAATQLEGLLLSDSLATP